MKVHFAEDLTAGRTLCNRQVLTVSNCNRATEENMLKTWSGGGTPFFDCCKRCFRALLVAHGTDRMLRHFDAEN